MSSSTIAVSSAEPDRALHADRGQRLLSAPYLGARMPRLRPSCRRSGRCRSRLQMANAAVPGDQPRAPFTLQKRLSRQPCQSCCGNSMPAASRSGRSDDPCAKGRPSEKEIPRGDDRDLFDSPVYRNYGQMLVKERFKPAGFPAPLGLKDMRLVGSSGETLRVPMPVLNVLRDHLLRAIATVGEERSIRRHRERRRQE